MKKFSIPFMAIMAFQFIACTRSFYLGSTYPVTQKVDVFYREQDVKEKFRLMGTAQVTKGIQKLETSERQLIDQWPIKP